MAVHGDGPSPALLEANRRLNNLRAAKGQSPAAYNNRWPIVGAQPPAKVDRPQVSGLPAPRNQPTLPVYPDLALAILGQGQSAAGRIWLLLRHLDRDGRGWLSLDRVRRELADDGSQLASPAPSLRVCGRRQLRNLLRRGSGLFWESRSGRLWLKSSAKVALALGVRRLSARPVALPVEALVGGIGQVRAHLYATFHSSRRQANPISRRTLEQLTSVPARTQRAYDRVAGVVRQANIALGEHYSPGKHCSPADRTSTNKGCSTRYHQELAWRHGRAVFTFVDRRGRQGPTGRCYLAWRLPNSYHGPHEMRPKGRKKKINRQIDLVTKRAQGNGLPTRRRLKASPLLFHPDGRSAARAATRVPTQNGEDIYWPQSRTPKKHRLWYVLACGQFGQRGKQ